MDGLMLWALGAAGAALPVVFLMGFVVGSAGSGRRSDVGGCEYPPTCGYQPRPVPGREPARPPKAPPARRG